MIEDFCWQSDGLGWEELELVEVLWQDVQVSRVESEWADFRSVHSLMKNPVQRGLVLFCQSMV